jgi:hypothetical protein
MCETWGNGKKGCGMNLTGLGWAAMMGLANTPMNLYGHKGGYLQSNTKGNREQFNLATNSFPQKITTQTYQPAMHEVKRKSS